MWCDEGVYSIAKEVQEEQLLRPEMFDDIFLGLGPFDMENIVMACLGSFLQCVEVDVALAESNVFGVDVVKSEVITGKHYIKSKEGMELVADAMSGILFDAFRTDPSFTTDDQLLVDYESAIHNVLDCLENKDMDDLRMQWEHEKVLQGLDVFVMPTFSFPLIKHLDNFFFGKFLLGKGTGTGRHPVLVPFPRRNLPNPSRFDILNSIWEL